MWRKLAERSQAEAAELLTEGALLEATQAFEAHRLGSSVFWRVLNLEMWLRGATGNDTLA